MSNENQSDINLEKTNQAVEKTAEASADAIEKTATASLEYVDSITAFLPWFEHWYFKIAIVILLGLLIYSIKRGVFNFLERLSVRSSNNLDDGVVNALRRPFAFLIFILCFEVSRLILFQHFAWPILKSLRLLSAAMLIFMVAMFVSGFITNMEQGIANSKRRRGIDYSRSGLKAATKFIRLVIYFIAMILTLALFGVSLTGLLAFGGVGGMVAGLAAKDMLANFFGAIMVYMDRPFRVGDWIRSPDRSIEGTVEDIGWRVTRIRTFDKRPLYVPNATFTTIAIENPSRMLNRRIYETIGIRYDDIEAIDDIVADTRKMLHAHQDIDQNNTLIVNLNAFSASSVDIMIYVFTLTTDWVQYHAIKQDVLLNVEKIIRSHGAEIAFPTTTMHIKGNMPQSLDSPLERQ